MVERANKHSYSRLVFTNSAIQGTNLASSKSCGASSWSTLNNVVGEVATGFDVPFDTGIRLAILAEVLPSGLCSYMT